MSDGICVVDLEPKPEDPSKEVTKNAEECRSVAMESFTTAASTLSLTEFCKICHCGAEPTMPLIAPCFCDGSLKYVHQECLQRWIKSSDIKRCELCKYLYIMQSKVKPFCQWEKLDMSSLEKRKLLCSIAFHVVAITCVIWSLYVLIDRTAEEIKEGNLHWPFWTKLVVVAIGFTGGIVFMYIQCKVYVHLCRKWKAYNRIIFVQDAPKDTLKRKMKKQSSPVELPRSVTDNSSVPQLFSPSNRSSTPGEEGRSSSRELPLGESNATIQKYSLGNSSLSCSAPDITSKSGTSSQVPTVPLAASKTNAETQTALRGVSLMQVLRHPSESQDSAAELSRILIDDTNQNASIFIAANCSQQETNTRQNDPQQLLLPGQSLYQEGRNHPSNEKLSE